MMYLKIPVINKSLERGMSGGGLNVPGRYTPLARSGIAKEIQAEFAKYLAEEMKRLLVETIKLQKYKNYWEPLSVKYLEYKKENNLSLNIWEASSTLVDSIEVRKYLDHYIIGVTSTKRYPGTNLKILQVAQWMEYGTETMPARPLFRRVLVYMRKNISRFFTKFLKDY